MRFSFLAAVAGAGLVLQGSTFEPDLRFTALDPIRQAQALCSPRRAQATLSVRLRLAAAASTAQPDTGIPLNPDLAVDGLPVTTVSGTARRYFNQGLMLSYGFNHAGAVRSFREAQRLDPACALCWWGEAAALGPNINAAMEDRDRGAALAALAHAQQLRDRASPLEQALIEALALRYSADPGADRAALDAAYADAMLAVAGRHPGQDDVGVLAAEAVMDTTPWNYWSADKQTPIGRSAEAVHLVETVLARNPRHPQANHLYIHLMENSADPHRAESAADRLAGLVPHSGHLLHMPAHIYAVLGRYADSIRVNQTAARADEDFIAASGDRGMLAYGYYPHNLHFIVAAAQMTGDMKTAIAEAQHLRTVLDPVTSARIAWIQAIDAAPYFAMAQFSRPAEILALPEPDSRLAYARAMRHYARAVAFSQRQEVAAFEAEISVLEALAHTAEIAGLEAQGMPAASLISLAVEVARGRLAFAGGAYEDAIGHYQAAIRIEQQIPYQEPSYWYYPVSQSLGAALLRAGRPVEASQAFRAALARTPANGWALYGLAQSEAARGATLEAAAARQALKRVWRGKLSWLDVARL